MTLIKNLALKEWHQLKILSLKGHNWGSPQQVSSRIIKLVDYALTQERLDPIVTSAWRGHYDSGSYHYSTPKRLCLAVDLMFINHQLNDLPDILLNLMRYPFTGVGIYAGWEFGEEVKGGIHLDLRPTDRRALWLHDGEEYKELNFANLQRYFTCDHNHKK